MIGINDTVTLLHHSYNGGGFGAGWGFIQSPIGDPEAVATALELVTVLS